LEIKARLTRHDKDIIEGLRRLNLKEGELVSDIVREGVRKVLRERGAIEEEKGEKKGVSYDRKED
jgi:Arc/MetJ-type ribon-helix-helix transcriptional regulator